MNYYASIDCEGGSAPLNWLALHFEGLSKQMLPDDESTVHFKSRVYPLLSRYASFLNG
jgi:hypothetical protein